jgi:hypothetical protein
MDQHFCKEKKEERDAIDAGVGTPSLISKDRETLLLHRASFSSERKRERDHAWWKWNTRLSPLSLQRAGERASCCKSSIAQARFCLCPSARKDICIHFFFVMGTVCISFGCWSPSFLQKLPKYISLFFLYFFRKSEGKGPYLIALIKV